MGEINLSRDIKKTSGKCSIIILIITFATYTLGEMIVKILRTLITMQMKNSGVPKYFISREMITFCVSYLPCILTDIVAIIICMCIFEEGIKHKNSDCIKQAEEDKNSAGFIINGCFAVVGIGILSSIIYSVYSNIIRSKGISIPSPDFSIPSKPLYVILFFSYTCILAPVFEEIIFRGYILNNLRKYGNITAVIISSVLFAMFHGNIVQFVNPILTGILLSFIVIKTDSIISSIIVHMFNNTIAMTTTIVAGFASDKIAYFWGIGYYLIGFAALIVLIVKYGKEFINAMKPSDKTMGTFKKLFYAIFNKWSIMYLLVYVAFLFMSFISKNAV